MRTKKTIKEILIFLALLIMVGAVILPRELNNLDEIWNFNFARNVADGRLPYKDFNMIQTPLLPLICGLVLKVLGSELIVMRLLACILCAAILFMSYKIMRKLKVNQVVSLLGVALLFYLFMPYFTIDYNFANILVLLILVYLELKFIDNIKPKTNLLIGILAGTTILFKQTTGIIISLICIFYKLLGPDIKENYKKILKQILIRTAGVLIPIIIGILYLLLTNSTSDFISYAIKGISSFMNNFVPYTNLLKQDNIIIKILAIIIPISSVIMYFITIVKKQRTDFQKKLFILFSYGIAEFLLIFPIAREGYLIMGLIINFIAIIYMVYRLFKLTKIEDKINIKIKLFIKYFFASFITLTMIYFVINFGYKNLKYYFQEANNYKNVKHFKYIPSNEKYINSIVNFIKTSEENGRRVYILDASAATFMIPADKCNKDFDMFLVGNLGKDGEEGQIEKIKNMNNSEMILIMNNKYPVNWQTPKKVIEYIIKNLDKIGEIGTFDLYVKVGINN